MPIHLWFVTFLFAMVLLSASLHLLSAVGQFPKEERAPAIATGYGTAILYATIVLVLMVVTVSVWLAATSLPWQVAVIAGGIAALVAPLFLQNFSDPFVDGFGSLMIFSTCALAAVALMWFIR